MLTLHFPIRLALVLVLYHNGAGLAVHPHVPARDHSLAKQHSGHRCWIPATTFLRRHSCLYALPLDLVVSCERSNSRRVHCRHDHCARPYVLLMQPIWHPTLLLFSRPNNQPRKQETERTSKNKIKQAQGDCREPKPCILYLFFLFLVFLLDSVGYVFFFYIYADDGVDPSVVALKNCLQISLDCILEQEIFLISLLAIFVSRSKTRDRI